MSDKHSAYDLAQMQSLPLQQKINMSERRIREWVGYFGIDKVYVSFSGGKDSTVLLDIARNIYPDMQAVFCDTGLNYPEIRKFVQSIDNCIWLKPEMNFKQIIDEYGYPIVSKEVAQAVFDARTSAKNNNIDVKDTKMYKSNFDELGDKCIKYPKYCKKKYSFLFDAPFDITAICCDIMKERPSIKYEQISGRKPIVGTLASESNLRRSAWFKYGCNAFNSKRQISKPLSFWTEQDILAYIYMKDIKYAKEVYGDIVFTSPDGGTYGDCFCPDQCNSKTTGMDRTGCMFCAFGCASSGWNNMQYIKDNYPKQYDFLLKDKSQGGLGFKKVFEWLNENGNFQIKY